MREPCSFIVRIYRFEPEALAGVVEDVQHGYRLPFHSMTELWAILNSDPPIKTRRRHNDRSDEQP